MQAPATLLKFAVHAITKSVNALGKAIVRTEARPDLGRAITPELPYLYAEVDHAVRHEMALTLADALIRRTHVIYETSDAGFPQAPEVAALMAEQLGWDEREQARQAGEYRKHVALTRGFRSADTQDIAP